MHLGGIVPRDPYVMLVVGCPDALVRTLPKAQWPRRWHAVPFVPQTQQLGDRWLAAGRSAALRVPSVHSTSDFNVLLNPAHAAAARLRVLDRRAYEFDDRLFTGKAPGTSAS